MVQVQKKKALRRRGSIDDDLAMYLYNMSVSKPGGLVSGPLPLHPFTLLRKTTVLVKRLGNKARVAYRRGEALEFPTPSSRKIS